MPVILAARIAAPATAHPATAAASSAKTDTDVGSLPDLINCVTVIPLSMAFSFNASYATYAEYASNARLAPKIAKEISGFSAACGPPVAVSAFTPCDMDNPDPKKNTPVAEINDHTNRSR